MYVTEVPDDGANEQVVDEPDLEPVQEGDEAAEDASSSGDELIEDADDPSAVLGELSEVLTVTAKKLSGLTLGRKFTTQPGSHGKKNLSGGKSIEERKRNSHCSVCGKKGHWQGDPQCAASDKNGMGNNQPAKSTGYRAQNSGQQNERSASAASGTNHNAGKRAYVVYHQDGSLTYDNSPQDLPEYGQAFSCNVVDAYTVDSIHDVGSVFAGYMVLDSACQKTCCGQSWFDFHVHELKRTLKMEPLEVQCSDKFQFGKGEPTTSTMKSFLPSGIMGKRLLIGTAVLPERIPLLGSSPLLEALGAVIDMSKRMVVFRALDVKVQLHVLGGHLAVRLFEFGSSCRTSSTWHDLFDRVIENGLQSASQLEVILPSDPQSLKHRGSAESLAHVSLTTADATASSNMASRMATLDPEPHEFSEQHGQTHESGGELEGDPQCLGSEMLSTGSANVSQGLPTQVLQPLRQQERVLRPMHRVSSKVQMGPSHRAVGACAIQGIIAVLAIVTTLLGDHQPSELGNSSSSPEQVKSQSQGQSYLSDIIDRYENFGRWSESMGMDSRAAKATRLGDLPQRSSLQAREPTRAGQDHSRRSTGSSRARVRTTSPSASKCSSNINSRHGGPDRPRQRGFLLRLGHCRRLRGSLNQSASELEAEKGIYEVLGTASDRRFPYIDIFELFSGSSKFTTRAPAFNMNALEPQDLLHGHDLSDPEQKQHVRQALKKFKPWLTVLGLSCRPYSIFNHNMNYSWREDEWLELQKEAQPLLDFAMDVIYEQMDQNRYFLLENPEKSELWSTAEIDTLMCMPGVWQVTLDTGAFGACIDDKPIKKPMTFIGNIPGLEKLMNQRLSQEERQLCTPIQGSMTRRSEEALVDLILSHLREVIKRSQPHRFMTRQVFAVAQPVEDLSAWDPVVNQIQTAFERSSRQPYLVDPTSTMGRQICDIMRMNLIRIQVVSTPTTRRMPPAIMLDYTHRASLLQYANGQRQLELEPLHQIQHPKQRFKSPVQIAVFMFGTMRRSDEPEPQTEETPPSIPLSGLPTDITFPGLPQSHGINIDTRRLVARLHLNMGHPSRQEMLRMVAYYGGVPNSVSTCIQHLECATCKRLAPPQKPRPSTMPSMVVGQFGDSVEGDIFYVRTLQGHAVPVLGLLDKATGLHAAGVLKSRESDVTFNLINNLWLRPYGLPYQLFLDPDRAFLGQCQHQIESMGIRLDFCPAEAHWMIGAIERRNSILRMVLEKLVEQCCVENEEQLDQIIPLALHAINSSTFSRGRSAFQATFGRIPRLPHGLLGDDHSLASSAGRLGHLEDNLMAKAEIIRAEAQKHLLDISVSQHFKRALLRKTVHTKVPSLQAGQPCAFWRWSKKGLKKRGSWVISRFLGWDPSSPTKLAWVQHGNTTILVTNEQLRAATGFEEWVPSEEDIRALKQGAQNFTDYILADGNLEDEAGPPPPEEVNEDNLEPHLEPPPVTMAVPATPAPILADRAQPSTPRAPASSTVIKQATTQNIRHEDTHLSIEMHSPTHLHMHRYGALPRTPRRQQRRQQSIEDTASAGIQPGPKRARQEALPSSLPAPALTDTAEPAATEHTGQTVAQPPHSTTRSGQQDHEPPAQYSTEAAATDQQAEEQPAAPSTAAAHTPDTLTHPTEHLSALTQQTTDHPAIDVSPEHFAQEHPQVSLLDTPEAPPTAEQAEQATPMESSALPQKRPYEAMATLHIDDTGNISRLTAGHDGTPNISHIVPSQHFYKAYLASEQRKTDIINTDKQADESDSSQDSDEEPTHKQDPANKLTRQEQKQLDREIPWQNILEMDEASINQYLLSIEKEHNSWMEWRSIEPLKDSEADQVLKDPILKKRCLRSRSAYRDKNRGSGQLRAKCRVVALGHNDPDLKSLTRSAPTPGRITEHILYCLIAAGINGTLLYDGALWMAWLGDAMTAFLQGLQPDNERPLPLFLLPPRDPLIQRSGLWTSKLYRVRGNIYGLPNAPHLWCTEVASRLMSKGYIRHKFDPMLFLYFEGDTLKSAILVYVDDFIGVYHPDYDINQVHDLFKWGELKNIQPDVPVTFKGKELCIKKNESGACELKITMQAFTDNLQLGKVSRGRDLTDLLNDDERQEFRSVTGCLQWMANQARLEVSPAVSLCNKGHMTTVGDLKALYEAMSFTKSTRDAGLLFTNIPVNHETMLITYTDASWANASHSSSQLGILVGITTPEVKHEHHRLEVYEISKGLPLDTGSRSMLSRRGSR